MMGFVALYSLVLIAIVREPAAAMPEGAWRPAGMLRAPSKHEGMPQRKVHQ
jgi:hypothetical protein